MKRRHRSLFTLLAVSLGVGVAAALCCGGVPEERSSRWDRLAFLAFRLLVGAGCAFVFFAAEYSDPPPGD